MSCIWKCLKASWLQTPLLLFQFQFHFLSSPVSVTCMQLVEKPSWDGQRWTIMLPCKLERYSHIAALFCYARAFLRRTTPQKMVFVFFFVLFSLTIVFAVQPLNWDKLQAMNSPFMQRRQRTFQKNHWFDLTYFLFHQNAGWVTFVKRGQTEQKDNHLLSTCKTNNSTIH